MPGTTSAARRRRRHVAEPSAIRRTGAARLVPNAAPQPAQQPNSVMSLPPEDQPETGTPKELPANLKKQLVDYTTKEPAGTIIVDTPNTYLYLVLGTARRCATASASAAKGLPGRAPSASRA